eukprot:CAMPEP_0172391368 /NCGR_PEP_ID=MMETSP1061-20121228/7790_1 /TAXON_ID=37318 /ORGANISM="Pseudo-nitzschia pungens, Strain cf. pungens" /LENGTH=54 /DNA_ID=CAMNT_0013121969 /DNA_START=30 /DNA_END=190 /DNA_ORIENTATION=+
MPDISLYQDKWRAHGVKRYMDSLDQAVEFKIGDRVGDEPFLSGPNSMDAVRRIT